jgi:hypothetical protein
MEASKIGQMPPRFSAPQQDFHGSEASKHQRALLIVIGRGGGLRAEGIGVRQA